ncbi:CO/xanthine dehydrogenase Mo-binding subunit [Kibdelosporangium banguiense]|uniref:CO/xanthine dehydrogenase Mo-binding subunit n=1 Tax=Kibdelosporangium banguiense TaxID=1365924 RepID=A0ABS4T5V5_9PSEU|nr:molybdopterin cofactor-binding domain-containing protein [Kibdelosporangium banguiense]MBP2319852.1 CO/xanthine dehydrogenase Mo-binding subunit [Kibdelosporangium banguiense]
MLSRWVTVHRDGTVSVRSGKVELGQDIHTTLAQIVAEELDVALHRIRMIPMITPITPDENLTAGSRSLEDSGTALRQVGAEVRACFLAAAADRLGSPDLAIDDGVITSANGSTSYWELADLVSLDINATGESKPKAPSEYRVVGSPAKRLDLPDKISGKPRYIHDLDLPGMLYGRIVRPPSPGATLCELDMPAAKDLVGVVEIVQDGSFLGVVATQEETAIAGAELLRSHAKWDEHAQLPESLDEFLTTGPFDTMVIDESGTPGPGRTATATYSRPYLAHASIAPSCGIARWDGANLEVWSHTQGAYNLRHAISIALTLPEEQLVVHHVESAGCYGHNGADDAAFDAVLLARAVPGQPVQVVWSRADELSWAPFGTAMAVRMSASLAEDGSIVAWQHETFGNGHISRPGTANEPSLLSAAYISAPRPIPVSVDPPTARGGGAQRNSVPLYRFAHHKVIKSRLLTMPLRTSALRGLGAFINVFAIESFMDELAGEVDPVEFRLRYLRDDRARMTVLAAADQAGWWEREPAENHGFGFGFARYSHHGAYCAVVAEVQAESEVRVERLTIAVDAGQIVNPDGLRNQIEGGAIQSTSWTLKEQVRFDRTHVTSASWESYPILRFSEVPEVDITLLDQPGEPYLGAGEAAQGPTAAAIANALSNAIGVRVRALPLTSENIVNALT